MIRPHARSILFPYTTLFRSYSLGLECLLPTTSPVDVALTCGSLASNRPIDKAAKVDQLTFSGQAGDRVTLTISAEDMPTRASHHAIVCRPPVAVMSPGAFNA